jgi:hypothetical protein
MSSQLSLHDLAKFCSNASAAFTLALGPTKSTLAAFVATQPITETSDIATCEFQIAGGMNPRAPRKVPVPIANPQRQATGLGPALGNAVAGTVTGVATVVGGIFSHLPGFGTPASTH